MDIPDTIKILGYNYTVEFEDSFGEGKEEMGDCNTLKQNIYINERCTEEGVASTLLHEILEALNYHMQLDLSHQVLMALEVGLYQILKENRLVFYED